MALIGVSRVKEILKYMFYFTTFILAVVNITFFICYWGELTPQLNDESILLSVVGFFFAFAGINIYSIFNTNIESEKEALKDLAKQYDGELKMSSKMLQFPQELIMIWQTCQYLTTSKFIQHKSFDWIGELRSRMEGQRDFVQELRDHNRVVQFERFREDLSSLAQGICSTLKQHLELLETDASFFKPIPGNEDNYKKRLTGVITFAEGLVSYDYEPEFEEKEKLSVWQKIGRVYSYARKMFGES